MSAARCRHVEDCIAAALAAAGAPAEEVEALLRHVAELGGQLLLPELEDLALVLTDRHLRSRGRPGVLGEPGPLRQAWLRALDTCGCLPRGGDDSWS